MSIRPFRSRTELAAFIMLMIGLFLMGALGYPSRRRTNVDLPWPYYAASAVFIVDAVGLYVRSKLGYWLFWPLAIIVGGFILLILALAVYALLTVRW